MVAKHDKSLGQYISSLHSILNETYISGIKVVETSNDKVKSLQSSIKYKHIHHHDYYQRFPRQNVPFIQELAG